jgi:hypothetical protein
VHAFYVVGHVTYRCYGGNDGKKRVDERTKEPCNGKTDQREVISRVTPIEIVDEPDPEDAKGLAGSWLEDFTFHGRKFTAAISLFRELSPPNYRLRIVARDDEPGPRETAVFAEAATVSALNRISVQSSSVGKKEEIYFVLSVQPATTK